MKVMKPDPLTFRYRLERVERRNCVTDRSSVENDLSVHRYREMMTFQQIETRLQASVETCQDVTITRTQCLLAVSESVTHSEVLCDDSSDDSCTDSDDDDTSSSDDQQQTTSYRIVEDDVTDEVYLLAPSVFWLGASCCWSCPVLLLAVLYSMC